MTKSAIIELIYNAIDEINQQLPKEKYLQKSENTVLFGQSGSLDSLGLVNLIVATEEQIEDECGLSITLANEKAMSEKKSPFRTVGTFADYIAAMLMEQANG